MLAKPTTIEHRPNRTKKKPGREASLMSAKRFAVTANEGQSPAYLKTTEKLKKEIEVGDTKTAGEADAWAVEDLS